MNFILRHFFFAVVFVIIVGHNHAALTTSDSDSDEEQQPAPTRTNTQKQQCMLVINELNSDQPGRADFHEFIELTVINCPRGQKPFIQDHVLLAIRAFSRRHKSATIELSATFRRIIWNKNAKYFVIGSLPNSNVSFDNDQVQYYGKGRRLRGQASLSQFLQHPVDVLGDGDLSPIAIALLKPGKPEDMQELKKVQVNPIDTRSNRRLLNNPQVRPVTVTQEAEEIIKSTIVDMIIYSRVANFTDCGLFERIAANLTSHEFNLTKQGLRIANEWDAPNRQDLSLNRCPRSESEKNTPFLFTEWKLSTITPFRRNNCSQTVRYVGDVDDGSQHINTNNVTIAHGVENTNTSASSTTTTVAPIVNFISRSEDMKALFGMISDMDKRIISQFDYMKTLFEKQTTNDNSGEPPVKRARLEIGNTSVDATELAIQPWDDVSLFKRVWFDQLRANFTGSIKNWPRTIAQDMRPWLIYEQNNTFLEFSNFKCRFCLDYLRLNPHIKEQYMPLFVQSSGYNLFNKTAKDIQRRLRYHSSSKVHNEAVLELKQRYESAMSQYIAVTQRESSMRMNQSSVITGRMIRTVFAAISMNVAFVNHETMVQLQKLNGLDMGKHHFEATSATRIMESIHRKMNQLLVEQLKQSNTSLSIMIDAATDKSMRQHLLVLIRGIEANQPKVYFYRALQMTRETAVNVYDAITSEFKKDGLEEVMQQRLIGFSADGAAVNMGRHEGVAQKLQRDYINGSLYVIHCLAHRLQLAILHAANARNSSCQFIKTEFEPQLNNIYSFYNNKAVKRKAMLRNTAEALDAPFRELNYIFQVRFVSSNVHAMNSLHQMYHAILTNLDHIIVSPASEGYSPNDKAQAEGLKRQMKDSRFLTTLLFLKDVLSHLHFLSKEYQKQSGVVIGQERLRQKLIDDLHHMRNHNGPNIQELLDNAKCRDSNSHHRHHQNPEWRRCTKRTLDNSDILVKLPQQSSEQTNFIYQTRSPYPKLSIFRSNFIQSLLEQINLSFPRGSMAMFDVLDPKNLPTATNETYPYHTQIIPLADLFINLHKRAFQSRLSDATITSATIAGEFFEFLNSLIEQHATSYAAHLDDSPLDFWVYFLSKNTVIWPANFRLLVEDVLVIPIGSSDVERAVSVLNLVRGDRRARLTGEHMNQIVFIKMNMPDLQNLNVNKYVKYWSETHMHTNDPRTRGKQIMSKGANDMSTLQRSTIF